MSIHFVSLSLQVSLPFHAAFGSALFNSSRMSGEGRAGWPKNWVGRECGNWASTTTSYFIWEEWEQHFFPPLSIFTVPLHLTGTLEHCSCLHDQAVQQYPSLTAFLMVLGIKAKVWSACWDRGGESRREVFLVWHLEESKGKKAGNGDNGTRGDRRWKGRKRRYKQIITF